MSQLTYNLLGLLYHLPINNRTALGHIHKARLWLLGYRWRTYIRLWADDPYTRELQIEELVRLSIPRGYIRTVPHGPDSLLLDLQVWCTVTEQEYLLTA